MTHLDQLPNPYQHLVKDREMMQHSACVSLADINLIKQVCPEHGLFTRATQVFYNSIAEELRQLNIKHYTPENSNELIAIIKRRVTGRCTDHELVGEGLRPNVTG